MGATHRNERAQRLRSCHSEPRKVGDGGNVLAFGDFGNALEERAVKGKNQEGPI